MPRFYDEHGNRVYIKNNNRVGGRIVLFIIILGAAIYSGKFEQYMPQLGSSRMNVDETEFLISEDTKIVEGNHLELITVDQINEEVRKIVEIAPDVIPNVPFENPPKFPNGAPYDPGTFTAESLYVNSNDVVFLFYDYNDNKIVDRGEEWIGKVRWGINAFMGENGEWVETSSQGAISVWYHPNSEYFLTLDLMNTQTGETTFLPIKDDRPEVVHHEIVTGIEGEYPNDDAIHIILVDLRKVNTMN